MLRPLISISLLLSLLACGDKDMGGVGSPPVLRVEIPVCPSTAMAMATSMTGMRSMDADGFAAPDDCDDKPLVNPDAIEECDEIDNNCDGGSMKG